MRFGTIGLLVLLTILAAVSAAVHHTMQISDPFSKIRLTQHKHSEAPSTTEHASTTQAEATSSDSQTAVTESSVSPVKAEVVEASTEPAKTTVEQTSEKPTTATAAA